MTYYSAFKNKKILSFTTRMNLEGIVLSEVNQTEDNKDCMVLICEICKSTNESIFFQVEFIATVEKWLPRFGGGGNKGQFGKRVQTFSDKKRNRLFLFLWRQ